MLKVLDVRKARQGGRNGRGGRDEHGPKTNRYEKTAGSIEAQFSYMDGKRVREWLGPNKKLAVTVMGKRRTEIAEGKHLDKKFVRRVTFNKYSVEYFEIYSKRKKSVSRDITSLNSLCPFFGEMLLDQITPKMVYQYQTDRLAQGQKPATVNRELALLKAVYNRAIATGKASQNPVVKVKLLKENNVRCRILDTDEREKFRKELHPRVLRIYDFACYTGLRQGEIFRLTWKGVDLKGGFLRVQ